MINKVSGKYPTQCSTSAAYLVSATITTRCFKMGRHAAQVWQRHGLVACSS